MTLRKWAHALAVRPVATLEKLLRKSEAQTRRTLRYRESARNWERNYVALREVVNRGNK